MCSTFQDVAYPDFHSFPCWGLPLWIFIYSLWNDILQRAAISCKGGNNIVQWSLGSWRMGIGGGGWYSPIPDVNSCCVLSLSLHPSSASDLKCVDLSWYVTILVWCLLHVFFFIYMRNRYMEYAISVCVYFIGFIGWMWNRRLAVPISICGLLLMGS